jgi:NAD(P)-dependent dehydrogenase (short-subunit alcohol dehydrogenase family)
MKILVIGATGTIGKAVVSELSARHEILQAGRSSAPLRVDIASETSLRELFAAIGTIDAIVCAAGNVHFGPLATMTVDQFKIGLNDKLLGQVQLALIGAEHLSDGGSITLTSGILSHDPIRLGANASTANAAIEGFVRAAAIELPRGIRINAVCATLVVESLADYGPYFRGFETVPVQRVATAYAKSVEGAQTGQVYCVG